jgi:hypothetical protein
VTSTYQTPAPHSLRRPGARLVGTAGLLVLSVVGLACTPGRPGDAAGTSAVAAASSWARLADRVPTPVLHWTTCRKTAQCATAELPLNYTDPHGATIQVALLRIRAKDPRDRLGTLFVNPGGPGDSARDLAFSAGQPPSLPASILDRFDVVGVDPRGVGGGSRGAECAAGGADNAFNDSAAEARDARDRQAVA